MKVVVHPIADNRIAPLADGQLELEDAIARAGWDKDDPGKGVAVIDEHGREIVNPARFEEPADIEAGQDMMAVMERRIIERLRREAGIPGGEDIEETAEESQDFNIGDDIQYVSGYEVEMANEWPTMPTPAPRPGRELDDEPAKPAPVRDDDRSGSDEDIEEPEAPTSREAAKSSVSTKSKSKERDPTVDR